ncbi:triphosphoribosyl-dephospho-CoA synthase [Paraburkholderia aromaticivorans]|uniref:Triphosphoribosyl-dephospho-CoA synthase n=1 Tax=Paraburkholderia aromaticivorans TaxID=2026199 RepID=A0A248VVL7_9BURK|nr:triphosphoribosyl-dephospho-CoA synthase [Paraburkholderia aromaticivorans]ASW03027.1 triphosphoribosyl-dephospho-CoA synthase [Paraburkholderia aromaticivorans]
MAEPPCCVAPEHVHAAFLAACRLDVETPKPGNVSVQSAGHGMRAAQFITSAEAAADALLARGAPVGQRVLDALTRTRDAVGCNTNLGILLLVAPLAAALEDVASPLSADAWRAATGRVLARLDIDDARLAYRAIALANPGGLGDAPEQPVHSPPTVNLRDAMRLAAGRDSIARQYAEGFRDIFETGLTAFREMPADQPHIATLNVFLTFLGTRPDSLIVRKQGMAVAQSVTLAAREQHAQWRHALAQKGPATAARPLDAWDAELKASAINPGTSADLTVATLFVAGCLAAARCGAPIPPQRREPRTGTDPVS